jgi:tetratricopeptide (TPR) repeat protein
MSAQDLFQQGIAAIREEKDVVKGRTLLTQALRLDPANDMAWVWLSRTISDHEKKLQCLNRALQLNPNNEQARKFKGRLESGLSTTTSEVVVVPSEGSPEASPRKPPSSAQQQKITALLAQAKTLQEQGKVEGAIEQWLRVLEIEPDHEAALGNAVRQLSRLKQLDDVKELIQSALNSGTQHPSVYMTAMDIARRDQDMIQLQERRQTH